MIMRLYHVGFQTLADPDIRHGRKNADFGQGFYLSDDEEFAKRRAKRRRGSDTVLNVYELECDGLNIKRFSRDRAWFDYICANRNGARDTLTDCDVVIGPIASDTLYDTFGIITSDLLDPALSLELLQLGEVYMQIVIKTDRAREQLRFLSSRILDEAEVDRYREAVSREEKAYQQRFTERLSSDTDFQ